MLSHSANCGLLFGASGNTTPPPGSTCRMRGLGMRSKENGRKRSWTLVSCRKQGPSDRALERVLQRARSPLLMPIVLDAQPVERPCTDPHARWCGRGGVARLPLSRSIRNSAGGRARWSGVSCLIGSFVGALSTRRFLSGYQMVLLRSQFIKRNFNQRCRRRSFQGWAGPPSVFVLAPHCP
jgi:hypothetical protein